MKTGFKFRCYPSAAQQKLLLRWIGCQRFIYNAKVSEDKYFRTFAGKSLSLVGMLPDKDQTYQQFKSDLTPWLSEVPSQVLRIGATRWMQAYSRFFKGISARPKNKRNVGRQSMWLTSDLFTFREEGGSYRLSVGTKKFHIGDIGLHAHRDHPAPKSIFLIVEHGKWFVSFCSLEEESLLSPEEIAKELSQLGEAELHAVTEGFDRGVLIPLCGSNGGHFNFSNVQKDRLRKKEKARSRWQRKMARRTKGSQGWRKAKFRAGACHQYGSHVRFDFAHKTSRAIVSKDNPHVRLLVFEKLSLKGMTKKPKAKQDSSGRWVRNGAKAKARLSSAILSSAWGSILSFTRYKALRANKLVIEVPAHHTSQECSRCGYTHKENRQSQAFFLCLRCEHTANADDNASQVIAKRGVGVILSRGFKASTKKNTMRMRKKVGVVCSEPLLEKAQTLGEIMVSRPVVFSADARIVDPRNLRS